MTRAHRPSTIWPISHAAYIIASNNKDDDPDASMKMQRFARAWDAIEEPPEVAASMRLRADLMIAVQQHVSASRLTLVQTAKKLGLTQPRLNDLLRGRIDKFSLDALVNMLARVGKQLIVKVGNAT